MAGPYTGITWRELVDFLTRTAGCKFTHQVGSHISGSTPTGAEINTCDPNKPGYVSTKHLEEIGRIFGKNLHDMLVWMGRKPDGKASVTRKRSVGKIPPPFQRRISTAADTIERTAIRIRLHGTGSFNEVAVKKLESIAGQLATCEDNLTSKGGAA